MMKKEKGFTLIELMIVVAIIGILAAAAIPRFGDLLNRARESNAKAALGSIRSAATIYYGRTEGRQFDSLEELHVAETPDDQFINELPGVNFRTYEDGRITNVSISWNTNQLEDGLGEEFDPGDTVDNPNGWAYCPTSFHIWIASGREDSRGVAINTW